MAELYQAGLTADQVAARLSTSRKTVLRTLHEHGVPVRRPPSITHDELVQRVLIESLYADRLVIETLARYSVPVVPAVGPIWVRFPEPIALTRGLLRDLYKKCGVGLAHIELLSGQPAATVRRGCADWGIEVRPVGGRSPFLCRLDAQS